ncbi:MAG: hypothetical protein GTN76_07535, partial [Candidatus Aenigmarchaeota archaeon]|nr:hypothetical protein [Candidatus Aenigmarchaeota archaeon]
TMFAFDHVLNRQSFRFLLKVEIEKARRYQNYLSLLPLTFDHLNHYFGKTPASPLKSLPISLRRTSAIQISCILGQDEANRILCILPHTNMAGVQKVRGRLEHMLQDYGTVKRGRTVETDAACFPTMPQTLMTCSGLRIITQLSTDRMEEMGMKMQFIGVLAIVIRGVTKPKTSLLDSFCETALL